jgi:hypothetical protein
MTAARGGGWQPRPADLPAAPLIAYCESCGTPHEVTGPGVMPFRACPECGLLECSRCWGAEDAERCASCLGTPITVAAAESPGRARPFVSIDRWTATGIAAAGAIIVAVAVGFGVFGEGPRGAVLDATGRPAVASQRVAGVVPSPAPPESPASAAPGSASFPPTETAPPSAAASPTPAAPSSSSAPSQASPAAGAALAIADQALVTWDDPFGEVRAEVIAEVQNHGTTPILLQQGASGYSIAAPDGRTVASGLFGNAFPSIVEPGMRAYLIDALAATFVERGELATVTVDLRFEPVQATATILPVDNLSWTIQEEQVVVSGRVRNDRSTTVGEITVGAILRDGSDRILCAVYDVGHIAGLDAGASAAFSTDYPEVQPAWSTDDVRIEAIAFVKPPD